MGENRLTNGAKDCVEFIFADLQGRKGLGDALDSIDEDIIDDMLLGWRKEIENTFYNLGVDND